MKYSYISYILNYILKVRLSSVFSIFIYVIIKVLENKFPKII